MTLRTKRWLDYYLGGLGVVLLYIPVRMVGFLLRRQHSLDQPRCITFVKILGRGSLFALYPALTAIRARHPKSKLTLICGREVSQFAHAYGMFDRVMTIDESGLYRMVATALSHVWWMFWNTDVTVDLEVHSRLTTVLTTLSMARNRLGFVDHFSLWRKRVYTHAIYFHSLQSSPAFDAVAQLFGTRVDVPLSRRIFQAHAKKTTETAPRSAQVFVIGVGCSDLSKERELPEALWFKLLSALLERDPQLQLTFLGGMADAALADKIMNKVSGYHDRVSNFCGRLKAEESIAVLARADAFIGVDSALIHLARFLSVPTVGFWGPTSPRGQLRFLESTPERHYYLRLACSPCVHLSTFTPCRGQNICMTHDQHIAEAITFLSNEVKPVGEPATSSKPADVWVYYPKDQSRPERFVV